MVIYENNGFMIEPVSTVADNSMIFRSSNYADSSYCPELRVCYNVSSGVKNVQTENIGAVIYPNPFTDQFTIRLSNTSDNIEVCVSNVLGQNILRKAVENSSDQIIITYNEIHNADGIIFVTISSNNTSKTFKLVANQ